MDHGRHYLLSTLRGTGAAPVILNGGTITAEHWFQHRAKGTPRGLTWTQKQNLEALDRRFEADTAPAKQAAAYERIRDEIDRLYGDLDTRAARRRAEQALADRIDEIADELRRFDLHELAGSLRSCRTSGTVGVGDGDALQIAWDHKCGQNRLCPDESREETQRLAESYVTEMLAFLDESALHRIFYCVPTWGNFRHGGLTGGKQMLFDRFRQVFNMPLDACPVTFHHGQAVRSRKSKLDPFPQLQGSLVIQEDPLSADGEWNVHLNAFLLWKGPCDFKALRAAWGANIHIREIKRDDVARALLEAVKYSAQIVPTKSTEKINKRQTEAPSMIEWPAERWAEWWDAQKGFRRVRSYGRLYAIHRKRWEKAEPGDRRVWLAAAGLEANLADTQWLDIEEAARVKLRRVIGRTNPPVDQSSLHWVAVVNWRTSGVGAYSVDLIPDHNFSGSRRSENKFGLDEVPNTGPPDW